MSEFKGYAYYYINLMKPLALLLIVCKTSNKMFQGIAIYFEI